MLLYYIKYQLVDATYTSQVDSLALYDPIEKSGYSISRKIKRGLYKSYVGQLINADIN